MTQTDDYTLDPRFIAGVDMLRRTGTSEFQIRWQDDQKPVVWIAVGGWSGRFEAAASMSPVIAVLRLCEQVIDGSPCLHCGKAAGFDAQNIEALDCVEDWICWYRYDPGAEKFIRGCD